MRDKYATQSELEAGKISDKLDDTAGVMGDRPTRHRRQGAAVPKKQENFLNSGNVRDVECVDNEGEG